MFHLQVPPGEVSGYDGSRGLIEHTEARACLVQYSLVTSLTHLVEEVDTTKSGSDDQDIDTGRMKSEPSFG